MVSEGQMKHLKEYDYKKFIILQKVTHINDNLDQTSQFAIKEDINLIKINGFEASCKNKQKIEKLARFFDQLFNQNEVIFLDVIKSYFHKKMFICWGDCCKETFVILMQYLNVYKHFSQSAARKFLHLERKEYSKFRTYVFIFFI